MLPAIVGEPCRAAGPGADAKSVIAFVDAHCMRCHGKEDPEGDLSLHTLSPDPKSPKDIEIWKKIFEQLDSGQMPPRKAKPPSPVVRRHAIASVKSTLKAGGVKCLFVSCMGVSAKNTNHIPPCNLFHKLVQAIGK